MKNEKLIRIIALILCAAMMMCMLTACKEEVIEPEEETEEEQPDEFNTIYEHIENDTPVMRIGDVDITWGVFYYYFYQEATKLYASQGEIYDWTAEYQNGETYLSYCASEAIYNNLRYIAGVEHFAKEYNVTVTDDQRKQMEEDMAYDIELFGDEAAMREYLTDVYLTDDTVEYLAEIEFKNVNVMEAMYGANGEKLTVEQLTEIADTAYKMAKVVAIPKSQPDALANAQAALAELNGVLAVDRSAKFDELIDKYCEPEKAAELKNGYVYTRGKFFDRTAEDAIKELDKNQYHKEVIEGEEYYFVAMRLPVDVDAHPYGYPYYSNLDETSTFGPDTLRYMYVDDIYEQTFWAWADHPEDAEVVFYDILNNLDIDAVLGWE